MDFIGIKYAMKSKVFPLVLSIFAIVMLIIFPDRYVTESYEGIKIFAFNVLPSLLPFFFFSQLLTNIGVGQKIGKLFSKPIRKLYKTNGIGGYILTMSALSGYPIGAKLISECCKSGMLGVSDAKSIIAYTSTSGPMFVLGTVGCVMLSNKIYGIVLLICHYLSAILNGLLYRNKTPTNSLIPTTYAENIWGDSAKSAISSISTCGVYVVIFYMLATMLRDAGVIGIISNLFSPIFGKASEGLVFGLIEMTGGCLTLSSVASPLALPTICAVISFGGLSVTFQSITFLSECGIKARCYLLRKFTQSVIAFSLTYLADFVFCL